MSERIPGLIVVDDSRPIYPRWCRVFRHRWYRHAYDLLWRRSSRCHRCEHIRPPRNEGYVIGD